MGRENLKKNWFMQKDEIKKDIKQGVGMLTELI